ncbi:MAG: hypothetical protein AVDCRST_MAG73-2156, partial [uncultured Thermomicrobiales bacterium]
DRDLLQSRSLRKHRRALRPGARGLRRRSRPVPERRARRRRPDPGTGLRFRSTARPAGR